MENTLSSMIQSGLRFWVTLLLMVPIVYLLSKKAYRSGDGWIKILGQDQFTKFGIAVLCLVIVLPLSSYIAAEIQHFLYVNLPSGKWLISLFGVGVLGVFLVLSDATNMNPNDEITRKIILASFVLIVSPIALHHTQRNYDLNQVWEDQIIRPIMQSIVSPVRENILLLLLGCTIVVYIYNRFRS